MRDLIIRNLDDALLLELKRRAWHQGLPLEESLRRLLQGSVDASDVCEEQSVFIPVLHMGAHRLGDGTSFELHA